MPFADDPVPVKADDSNSFGGGMATADPPAITGKPTWGDVLSSGESGGRAAMETGAGFLASMARNPQEEAYWRQQGDRQRELQQQDVQEMTPAGQQAREGSFFSHPLVVGAEAIPGLATIAVPTALASATLGPVAGAAVAGGIMGAQTRGDVYSRLTQEGIEPTSNQLNAATALGVATGLATEPVGALVGKAAVSPIVRRALGVTGDAAVFGASSGAQEYTSQKAEIAGGKRVDLDPGAILGATETGAETGAGFGAIGSRGHPEGTQTGGEVTVKRTQTHGYIKPEAQKDYTGAPPKPPAAPPPPTELVVDPDSKAALDANAGKAPTLGVGEQPGVAQAEAVQPSGEAAQDQQGAPPAGETAPPPSPPPPAGEPGPAPAPAAATPAPPPVPDSEATLREQHRALIDPDNPREAMVYPQGVQPFGITTKKGRYGETQLADGRTVQFDRHGESKLSKAKIAELDKNDKLNELLQLGPVSQTEAVQQSVAGVGDPAVVTERAPPTVPGEPGVERKAAEVTTATAPETAEALEATKTPGSTIQQETHEETVGDRLKRVQGEIAARKAEMDAGERGEFKPEPASTGAPTPESKAPEPVKMAETKHLSVWDRGDGTYFKRYADGREEPVTKTVADLLAKQGPYVPEKSEAEKIREAAQATAPPPPVRRILRSETEEERQAAARQAEADAEAAARVQAEAGAPPKVKPIKPIEEVKAGKKSPEVIQHQKDMNTTANDVVDRNQPKTDEERNKEALAVDPSQPGGKGARVALLARVKQMLEDAKTSKFEFMKRAMHRTDEETRHSNKSLILYEAKLLEGAKAGDKDYGRFLANEDDLLKNGQAAYDRVLNLRKESGKEIARERGKPTGEAQGVEDIEKAGMPEAGSIEKPDVHAEMAAAKERIAEEATAKAPGEERKETPLQKQAREASERAQAKLEAQERAEREGAGVRETSPGVWRATVDGKVLGDSKGYRSRSEAMTEAEHIVKQNKIADEVRAEQTRPTQESKEEGEAPAAPRAAVGFKVEARGRAKLDVLRAKINEAKSEPKLSEQRHTQEQIDFENELMDRSIKEDGIEITGNRGKVTVFPSHIESAEDAIKKSFAIGRYVAGAPQIMGKLRDLVVKIAGDTPVYHLSDAEMEKLTGHDDTLGAYSSKENLIIINKSRFRGDTVLHETFHAATDIMIKKHPELRDLVERLRVEVLKNLPDLTREERADIDYFLSKDLEFLNGMMTNWRMQELLKNTKISKELAEAIGIPKWRKMTMWEGALSIIRKALGLGPRDTNAIEAAMSLTEQAIWRDPRGVGDLMSAVGRMANKQMEGGWSLQRAPPERDQEAVIRSPKESLARVKDIDKEVVKQFTKDKLTNLSGALMKGSTKLLSGTWLNDMHGHLFEDAKGKILEAINDARNRVSHAYNQLMTKDLDHINRGYKLDKTHATQMADYSKLMDMSQRYNIRADQAAPKPSKANKYVQRDKFDPEARALYDKLHPDLQKRYTDDIKYYRESQAGQAQSVLDATLPLYDPPKGSTLKEVMERASKNDLTESDLAHYEDLGVAGPLREASRLASRQDVYANTQRDGRWAVTGRYEMPKGGKDVSYSGSTLPDNVREFDTNDKARDYMAGTRMKATAREAYYVKDKATGKYTDVYPSTPETEKAGIVGKRVQSADAEETRYRVSLERQNYQLADSRAEAERNRQAMDADGVKELSGVMDKRDEKSWSTLNSADQHNLERKIDSRKDLTDVQKQHMKDTTRQMMLASRGGMSAHMIQARKVAGAKFDTAAGLHAYARAANFQMAHRAHASELSDAMSRLDTHEKATRSDDPDNATRRSIVANEMRDRVYGVGQNALSSASSPLVHKFMTWAFINFLARPSHIILSQLHPYIYSVPMIAAKHGYWKALQGQRQAMKDLGGMGHNLKEGFKAGVEVYKSGKEKDIDKAVAMAHGANPILRMISGLKDKGERDAMMNMWETEHLHSAFDASVFSGGGMDRTNAIVRQFTDAMEANNRLSTALNAYRLERDMHKDPANALAYSRRVIEQTHGVFSSTNAASVFKNPIMRPIMQFRQQPMNLAVMMYRNMGKAVTGDTEARWTLAYQLGTAAALGGMGGMPMDLPKLAGLAGQAAGGPSPADWDDKFYRTLVDNLGKTAADAIHDGIPGMMGPYGPSLGHRTGFDAGFLFGEPKSDNADDLYAYTAKSLAGASVGMGMDWLTALHQAQQGDFERAGESFMPGSLKDFLKAYRNATQGVTAGKDQIAPGSFGDELQQFLGFSSVERERQMAGHFALKKELAAEQAAEQQTVGGKFKAAQQARRDQAKSVLGVRVGVKQHKTAREYEDAYQ